MSKQTLITDFFNRAPECKIRGYNEKTGSWHCLECGEDMGSTNSRQLCCKSYCKHAMSNYNLLSIRIERKISK